MTSGVPHHSRVAVDPAACVLARLESRLLDLGAYEALWHLQRLSDDEMALLIEREISTVLSTTQTPESSHDSAWVAA